MHLHHKFMARPESMTNIRHGKTHLGWLVGLEGFGFGKAVSELAPEGFTPNQHLVIAHPNSRGIRIKIWVIIWENINYFHYPIGVCSRGANP